jgi:methionyl-tRNA formyltransferase
VREPAVQEELRSLRPELQVVVAYGQILPKAVIDMAPLGTVNVHASLLPRLRGAAPIQWAIARGDAETGVTTMLIDEGLDTGPMLLSRSTSIGPEETASDLESRLARLGADVLLDTVRGLADGSLKAVPQDHALATLAPLLKKEDGRLDWSRAAHELANQIRGFHPWPGAYTTVSGRVLKVLKADVAPPGGGEPGTMVEVARQALVVSAGGGTRLALQEVQPESRRPMSGAAYAAGARLERGMHLGGP